MNAIGYICNSRNDQISHLKDSWADILCKVGLTHWKTYDDFKEKIYKYDIKQVRLDLYQNIFHSRHKLMIKVISLTDKIPDPVTFEDKTAFKILKLISNQYIRKRYHESDPARLSWPMILSEPNTCLSWDDWFSYLNHI